MGNLGIGQNLIDGKFGLHHRVVGGRKDRFHLFSNQILGGLNQFVVGSAGFFHHGHAFALKITLGSLDRGLGRILTHIVKQTHLLNLRVGGKHQVHHSRCIQKVACAGDVLSRFIQRFHQPCRNRVRNGGKHHRDSAVLRGGLHGHSHRCGHTDHQIHLVVLEVLDNLVHHIGVCLAILKLHRKGHILLLAQLRQPGLNVVHDLI